MTDTSATETELVLARTEASDLPTWTPQQRAEVLVALSHALNADRDALVDVAHGESHLGPARLHSELARTRYQLEHWAGRILEGSCFDAVIEHADPDFVLGARPDLRRVNEPLGPVLVFAASNFPFAFSVLGGDTASALAAGCPVIVKAHPGHPRLSNLVATIANTVGAPVEVVHGLEAARAVLLDRRVRAAAFTGSTEAGRALFDLAAARPDPIPFYGELGSINPCIASPGAVRARGEDLVEGFVGSFTLGAGQFCTKPGVLLLPHGHGLEARLQAAVASVPAAPMLGEWVESRFLAALAERREHQLIRALAGGDGTAPTLLATSLEAVVADPSLLRECFGPTCLIVEYASLADVLGFARALPGALTATVHAEAAEADWARPILDVLRRKAGRVIWNGWPTGVAVSDAMHHGGPWPATTSPMFSSVGGNAIARFLRAVSYQAVPDELLPPTLQEANPHRLSRRVNGALL